jgi:glycosyltransferase involved in cell wall biosynthesis
VTASHGEHATAAPGPGARAVADTRLGVVAFTPIWPNAREQLLGPYNVLQLRPLLDRCRIEVLCAVPYFPLAARIGQPARAAELASLPDSAEIEGMTTRYVRQLYVPKVGLSVAVPLALASLAPHLPVLRKADVVLATWAYPHGCAAVLAARALRKPVVVKVHGSDLNVIAQQPSARAVMRRVLPRADAMVVMSRALGDELASIGVDRARIHLVQNGVKTDLFRPQDRAHARRALGLDADKPLVLYVGSLKREKGVVDLLDAFATLRAARPEARLALLGDGPARAEVEARRASWGEAAPIAPGGRPSAEVATWMAAADVITLPSWMEGQPNVVLEALASGRPVVASRVGGIPDALRDPETGILVDARDVPALCSALAAALARPWDPARIVRSAPGSWDDSADRLYEVLRQAAR